MSDPTPRFPDLNRDPVALEGEVLARWEAEGVFARTQAPEPDRPNFVFYEGPPTANGDPGVHHVITRLAKDAICRYKAMTGHHVLRKAGWDTHGLAVELEVQKALGLKDKAAVQAYGIERFNAACRESVFRYEREWREMTRRIGYWLDLDTPYITCTPEYVESVWWLLKRFWDEGLLYEGHKVMPYNPRLGTVYSSHEVAQGYQEVEDPSVTVRFRLVDDEASLLVWTTTPWTLLSNVAAAVHPDLDYVTVRLADGEKLVLAEARLAALGDRDYEVVGRVKGRALAGRRYRRLYEYAPIPAGQRGGEVVAADFVSAEDGTGIVHIAPAYGADDYEVSLEHDLAVLALVGPDGRVVPEAGPFAGLDFKAADPEVLRDLTERGLMFEVRMVRHTYPHCWRDHGPLIYFAQPGWFIRTTALRDRFLAANAAVRWVPAEVGENRFGNWLEGNIDWALSRDRFWGTPLPIWKTESGEAICIGSLAELRELAVDPPAELDPHKPFVDEIVLRHPETGELMRRVPDVIDAWFDSGAMPFAQWHYPFENEELFESQFPADFICEAVDQSRGWFYSLLAIAVFQRDCAAYKSVLVSGHVVDIEGKKMSKSLGNRIDPFAVLDRDGADALRLYMATAAPIWSNLKFDMDGPREMNSKALGTLRNTYAFLALYANLDGWAPGAAEPAYSLLDRWLRSRYETLVAETRRSLDDYDLTRAAKGIAHFIVEELSNWYVRRSRRRFWKGEMTADKAGAYETLHGVLEGLCRLAAPFIPFLSDAVWRALTGPDASSVHLAAYPEPDASRRDEDLEDAMAMVLQTVSLGRVLRNQGRIRVRQPLAELRVAGGGRRLERVLADAGLTELILDELNIKTLTATADSDGLLRFTVKPRFKTLGPRLGGAMKAVAGALAALPPDAILAGYREGILHVEADGRRNALGREDLDFGVAAEGPWEAGLEGSLAGALCVAIDDALAREGHLRELVNRVQKLRKTSGLAVSDRIHLRWEGGDLTRATLGEHGARLAEEVLALTVAEGAAGRGFAERYALAGEEVRVEIDRA
ncbi:MAG: isoleucine--tRNA ligase [Candidatus Krumholzibacteriota bacterium]|nr:isoleucine--tRNA ligase [Candidatus Krumholzibacteriota bacterium]